MRRIRTEAATGNGSRAALREAQDCPRAQRGIGQSAGRAPLWGMTPESGSGTQRSVQPWGETVERSRTAYLPTSR